jgi:predicted nucleotidyltransferase
MRAKTERRLEGLRARRDEILRVAARHGGFNIRVFGSVARGEDDEQSDVDLLMDFDETVGGFEYFGRQEELRVALSALLGREVNITDAAGLRDKFVTTPRLENVRERILGDATPL